MNTLSFYLDTLYDGLSGFVYSPVKTATSFEQHWFDYPREKQALIDHISNGGGDVYISPAVYSEKRAVKESIKTLQCVWVEFDGVEQIDFQSVSEPTMIVQTSFASHVHCYWRIDRDTHHVVEKINRELTYYLHADSSGWDATQLLRPPETVNHKHNLPVVLASHTLAAYNVGAFDFLPTISAPAASTVLVEELIPTAQVLANNTLPLKVMRMVKKEEPVEPYRSSFLMRLAHELAEEDLTHVEIVSLLYEADGRIKKYDGRNDQLVRLSQIADHAMLKHIAEDTVIIYTPEQILKYVEQLQWILPQWLHATGQLVISSAPGVGKTQWCMQLAYSLATGRSFLGMANSSKYKVLVLSLEMDKQSLKYIFEHQQNSWEETPLFDIVDETQSLSKYEDLIEERETNVLIVDSLTELLDDEEETSPGKEARRIMKWCRKIRRRYGLAVILIHHNRKATEGNKKPKGLADLAGSFQFAKDTDTVLQLWEDYKGIELSGVKVRFGHKDAFMLARSGDLWFTRKESASNPSRPAPANQERDQGEQQSSSRHGDELHRKDGGKVPPRFRFKDGPQ